MSIRDPARDSFQRDASVMPIIPAVSVEESRELELAATRFMSHAKELVQGMNDYCAAVNAIFAPNGLMFVELDKRQREYFRNSLLWDELGRLLTAVGMEAWDKKVATDSDDS